MSYPHPAANADQPGPDQSGEFPSVRKTNPKDVTTVAPPPKSGVHHAVPIPKAPLPPTALPRVKSGAR